MGRRTSRRLLVGLATVAMFTAACSGSSDSGSSSSSASGGGSGGSFSYALGTDPSFLAPTANCYESTCSQVLNSVYTGLLSIDPETNEQILGTAESIDSPDGKVWTIKLKDGQKFQNGEPVDAASYVRAWNYSAYGPNATQTGFFFNKIAGYDALQGDKPQSKAMSGVKAIDDLTIQVTLSEPFSQWPLVMSYTPAFAPAAKACLADIKACNEKPIGNGPYELTDWTHDQSITLKKWADYQGDDPANADEIDLPLYSDLATSYRDFQAGNVDIVQPDPSQIPQAQASSSDRLVQVDSGNYSYMGFPFYIKAFNDLRIRQALSMSIDRQTIIDRVLNGLYTPATDVVAPFVTGSQEGACKACTYNPDEAKKLFDEAGGIPGNKIAIWFNNDGGHEQWVQAVAEGWKNDLGLDYELKSQPFTPYLKTLGDHKVTGPYRLGWLPDYPSPENYLDPIYGAGSTNYGEWSGTYHDQFLKLIAQANAAPSIEEGIPIYQQAADIVDTQLPVIPLWFGKTFFVYSQNVDNVKYDPLRQLLLGEVTVNG